MLEWLEGRTLWSVVFGPDGTELGRVVELAPLPATAEFAAADVGTAGAPGFQIEVVFPDATLTPSQRAVFTGAAARWQRVITGDLPDASSASVPGGVVDDLRIEATAPAIDGPGQILGQAGPRNLRISSGLPFFGEMEFDSADVAALEANGRLNDVILHEMGHVLGFGTIWANKSLRTGTGGADPRYVGPAALAEYNAAFGTGETGIPLENTGGEGTRDSHWREATFGAELMTGFLNGGVANPMSRFTAAQFIDLGYPGVDLNAADVYPAAGVGNPRPTITSLTASPNPAPPDASFTLTANGVSDNSGVGSVRFYRETNGLPGLQTFTPGGDTLLSTATSAPYAAAVSTAGLAAGTVNTYYAQAVDNQGLNGAVVSTTVTIAQPAAPTVTGVFLDSTAWAPAFRAYLANNALGSFNLGLRVPAGASQLQVLPFINVNKVSVQFSAPVSVQEGDLSVRGVNVPSYAFRPGGFAYDAATNTATWTLTVPVSRDRVLLDLDGESPNAVAAAAVGGAPLDGEWANGADAFPSGNGSAGGDFRFQLNVLGGDVTRNGRVDSLDQLDVRLRQFAGTSNPGVGPRAYAPVSDVDGSGLIDSVDFAAVRARLGRALPAGSPSLSVAPTSAALFAARRIGATTTTDRDALDALFA